MAAAKKSTPATKKAAAAAKPPTPRRRPGSLAEQIDHLEAGQSIALSERLVISDESTNDEAIKGAGQRVRSALTSYVSRVVDPDLDDREFVVESGSFLTDSKTAIIVNATVTRLR